ncbi:MAG: hypothetical protein NTW86_29690 [Candidatus Sumerlaeota bacterium]|nr:hypothetical protein [Candidatus Sumerlaeota bacterium]
MGWVVDGLKSTVGKKYVVAAMGLLLCAFLVGHLIGNLMIYGGPGLFNAYAEKLESIPILLEIELALAAVFLLHIVFAVITW